MPTALRLGRPRTFSFTMSTAEPKVNSLINVGLSVEVSVIPILRFGRLWLSGVKSNAPRKAPRIFQS